MADYINNEAAADGYVARLSIGPDFEATSAVITVANNPALMQFAVGKLGSWRWTDEREFFAIPQSFKVSNIIGVRFRNALAGQTARVLAVLTGDHQDDPIFESGIPFTGVLAANGTVTNPGGGAMQVIQDQILLAPQGNIIFANIPQTFVHLVLYLSARDAFAAPLVSGSMQFNGDAGANYDQEDAIAVGAAWGVGENYGLGGLGMQWPGSTAGPGLFSAHVFDIHDYTNANKNKALVQRSGSKVGIAAGSVRYRDYSGFWRSNAPITNIALNAAGGGAFTADTRATLYGLTAA